MDKKESAALTVAQAWDLLGGAPVISRAAFYNGLRRGQIPGLKIGTRIIIPRGKFLAWLDSAGLRTESQADARN